jgi:hypothetical protein
MAHERAQRIDVPSEILAADTLTDPNYTCAFTAPLTNVCPAENWFRAMFEDAPRSMRWFITTGWVAVLGLRLGPRPSPDHILGWKILSTAPTQVVIGISGSTLSAHQVAWVSNRNVVHVTIVRYDRPIARVLWALAAPIHVRAIPYLMQRAQ